LNKDASRSLAITSAEVLISSLSTSRPWNDEETVALKEAAMLVSVSDEIANALCQQTNADQPAEMQAFLSHFSEWLNKKKQICPSTKNMNRRTTR
jgi:hypothetical protein